VGIFVMGFPNEARNFFLEENSRGGPNWFFFMNINKKSIYNSGLQIQPKKRVKTLVEITHPKFQLLLQGWPSPKKN
jgi:hypothetical protein